MLEFSYDRSICFGIAEKLSGMGYKFHKRLLLLDEGILSYYSKIPSDAENGTLNLFAFKAMALKPKSAIAVKHIQSIRPADRALAGKKKKSNLFIIEFKKSAFLDNKSKGDQELQWVFSVESQEDFDKWISIIEEVKTAETVKALDGISSGQLGGLGKRQSTMAVDGSENPRKKSPDEPKGMIKSRPKNSSTSLSPLKFRETLNAGGDLSPNKSSFAGGMKSKTGKRVQIKTPTVVQDPPADIPYGDRLQQRQEELDRDRKKEEEIKKQEAQMKEAMKKEQEEMLRKQRELEEKIKQEQQEKLKIAWEYKFNLLMEENIKTFNRGPKSVYTIGDTVSTGFKMLKFIGKFRTEAVNLCKSIIDEFTLAASERVYAAHEKITYNKQSKPSQRIFFISNIIVRLTWADRENVEVGDETYRYLYTDKTIKSFCHEFRAMDTLNDILYLLNKDRRDVVYRVPLAVVVDYKGFRCLVISCPPVDGDETLQLGPIMSSGTYRANGEIDEDLGFIGGELKLKEHTFLLDDNVTAVNVKLSVFTEIHKVMFSGYEEETEDLNSPTSPDIRLGFGDRRGHDCYYFMKTADIFPVDLDLETTKNPSFLKRLRPEFMLEYEKPLSADALVNHHGPEDADNEIDDLEVAEAGIYLRTVVVPTFVKKLDALEIIMIDSESLTQALHCHGINIRYLGLICQQTNLPHVKEMCIIEMVARTTKKILRKEMSNIVFGHHEDAREEENESFSTSNRDKSRNKSISKDDERRRIRTKVKMSEVDQSIGDCVIEILNFIFGKGKDSVQFWTEVMAEQILYDYNYDMKNFQKTEISLGGLLHAVLYHCNLKIKLDKDSSIEERLDKVVSPFPRTCYEGIKTRSKIFTMRTLDVKSRSEKYKQIRATKDFDVAIQCCRLAQSIEESIAYKEEGYEDPILLGELAEIYFEKGHLEEAYKLAKEALARSRMMHVEAVKALCIVMRVHMARNEIDPTLKNFELAISYLNFHLGLYHPMHATVYSIVGSYFAKREKFQDALYLYKASLTCCVRALGPNHPTTGEVYLDLGNLTLKMHQQEDALNYFEKAFYVFEASKGDESIECANTSYMIATLLLSFGKMKEAMTSVQHALKIYEKNEESYVEKIAECCLLVCSIGEIKNDDKLTLDHASKIWNIINRIPIKNKMDYTSRILTLTLTALTNGLTADRKNFLYYISDSIVDVMGQENKRDRPFGGGGEDATLQKECLEEIFIQSQAYGGIQAFLKYVLNTLFQNMQERDLKEFFRDYRGNWEMLNDSQLKECLEYFEMLIVIHGSQYFRDARKRF